jgi:Predicted membrane protein
MDKDTRKMTSYAMFLALSMILGYLESMIPTPFPIPGIKLGLANIVNIIGLFSLGILPTGIISFLRVLLLSMLFGNLMTLSYSMAGFFLSFFVMILAKQCFKLSFISEKRKHISLVALYTGLIKGIHAIYISGDTAGKLEEIEKLSERSLTLLINL